MPTWATDQAVLLGSDCPLPLDQPFTLGVAAAAGVSRQVLKRLVHRGLVRRVGQGVYAAAQAPDTIEFRAAALRLVIAPSAVATDLTAAWLHKVDLLPPSARRVMPPLTFFERPGYRTRRREIVSGERLLQARDITDVHGVAVTTPLRTACDLGRLLYRFDALAALDQFLRLGVPREQLLYELGRFKGYRGVVQLRMLVPLADGRAESVPESYLRLYWYDAGLPAPEPQYWVFDEAGFPRYRLDLGLPEVRYGAEYNGEEFHSSDEDKKSDEERLGWLDRRADWHIEVFDKTDLYVPRPDPIPRLVKGLFIARSRFARRPVVFG